MNISINTEEPLGATEIAVLKALIGQNDTAAPAAAPAAAPKAAAKAAAKPKAKPAPAPEPEVETEVEVEAEEDVAGDGPTMEDAVAKATKLVSSGQAAKVKAALVEVGAKKVSEIATEDLGTFIDALS